MLVYLTRVVRVGMMRGVLDLAKVMGAQLDHGGGSGQDVEIDVVHQGEGGGQVDGGSAQLFHGGGRGRDVEIDVVYQGEGGGQVDGGGAQLFQGGDRVGHDVEGAGGLQLCLSV